MSVGHRGFLMLAASLLLVLGLAQRSPSFLLLAAAHVALLVAARVDARRRERVLHAFREAPASATENETVPVRLALENQGHRPLALVRVEDAFGASLAEARALLEPGPLPGRHRRRYEYRGDCSRGWGVHTLGPLVIETADPFGLFPRRRALFDVAPLAVYPRLDELQWIPGGGVRRTTASHAVAAPRPGDGSLYVGVRDYRRGDDARRIHWPATARRGSPVVKEMETDLLPYMAVVLDLDRRHRGGTGRRSTSEALVRTAASLLHTAARRGWVVQLVAEGAAPLRLPAGSGASHLAFALHALMQVRQGGDVPLLDLLEREAPSLPPGASLAVVSGTIWLDDARLRRLLDRLHAHGVLTSFVLVSADTYVAFARHAAAPDAARARETALRDVLRSRGVPAVVVHADDDLHRVLRTAAP